MIKARLEHVDELGEGVLARGARAAGVVELRGGALHRRQLLARAHPGDVHERRDEGCDDQPVVCAVARRAGGAGGGRGGCSARGEEGGGDAAGAVQ